MAIAVAASDIALHREGSRTVNVRRAQRSAGVQNCVRFRQIRRAGAGNDGGIVGTVDGEEHLLGGAIQRSNRKSIDLGAAGAEGLREAVGNRVSVAAVAGQRERAEIALRRGDRGLESSLPGIGIGDRDRADRGQIARTVNGKVLGDSSDGRIADHRRMIAGSGAVNDEGDLLNGAVKRGDGESIDLGGADAELGGRAFRHGVGIGPVAVEREIAVVTGRRNHRRLEG